MELITLIMVVLVAYGIRYVVTTQNREAKMLSSPPETLNPPEEDTTYDASKFLQTSNRDKKEGAFVISRL